MTTAKHEALPPPRSGTSLVVTILLMAISALLSGYVTSTILDKEYKIIFAEMQKDCHQIQNDYLTCRSHAAEETTKWRIYADQNIRACQGYVERHLGEDILAYKLGSDGLGKAINRTLEHEALQFELTQSEAKATTLLNSNIILNQEVEALEKDRAIRTRQIKNFVTELEDAERALELRDLERVECDRYYRDLINCEESLDQAKQDNVNNEAPSSHTVKQLSDQVKALQNQGKMKEAMLEEMGFTINDAKKEIQSWKVKSESLVEKVNFRSRRDVLKQYGPGPHYVQIALSQEETILLKMAPLDLMSHTIHIFMNLIQEKMYVGGTFLLAREHILVAAPIDAFDPENNQRLEEEMVDEGYFPDGALLFHQYSPEFPHAKYTVGFSSTGGPLFYINIQDNIKAHGPRHIDNEGDVEGDPVFAEVVEGFEVIQRILALPRNEDDSLNTRVQIVDTYVVESDAK
mmetsp:Transcript_31691/g.47489  ORF Transcript_31691/g.47489 Transcript_31691/m.47489 type:complete len:461 (-) Transcript_31691:39-1421(-)